MKSIIFINLSNKIVTNTKSFAFFNKDSNRFLMINDVQTWDCYEDFYEDFIEECS